MLGEENFSFYYIVVSKKGKVKTSLAIKIKGG